jgi:biotin carboxyl carrier protein
VRRYRVTVDGRTYEVEIDDPRARPITARVLGEVFTVEVDSAGHAAGAEPPAGGHVPPAVSPAPPRPAPAGGGQQVVTAPIPGTITALVASVGQAVERGDGLLTIEAMKMFNVIRSPWAGTVTAVHVAVGGHVAQGEMLISLSLA